MSHSHCKRKLVFEYGPGDYPNTSKLFKITIYNNFNVNPNHRWELYYTDINIVLELSWLLVTTYSTVKNFIKYRFSEETPLIDFKTKLACLIERFRNVQLQTQPSSDVSQHFYRILYTAEAFTPGGSVCIPIRLFILKIVDELTKILNISLSDLTLENYQSRINILEKEINDLFIFIRYCYEDFFIFTRMSRGLTRALQLRELSVTMAEIENELIRKLKDSIEKKFKNLFPRLNHHEKYEMLVYALNSINKN